MHVESAGSHRAEDANASLLHLQASRKLHERMAFAIFRSPMTFFETTPAGRILNRFSRFEPPLLVSWRETAAACHTVAVL